MRGHMFVDHCAPGGLADGFLDDRLVNVMPAMNACPFVPGKIAGRKDVLPDPFPIGLRVKHYSARTEDTYVAWVKNFILFHNKRHPSEMGVDESDFERLGKLKILSGVCKFPARVKCASLAWHTVNAALKGTGEVASTE